jgi:hypothetical protein
MYSSFEKKKNLLIEKFNFSIILLFSILIFVLNLIYSEKFVKINFFLKKNIDYANFNIENLFLNFKKIHFNSQIFFENIKFNNDLYKENLNLKNQIELLNQNNQKNLNFLNFRKNIEKQIKKDNSKFGFIPGFVFFDSKNEILISIHSDELDNLQRLKLKSKKFLNELQNNLILDQYGPVAKIKKIYEIDKNFIIFAQKINHENFKIPIIINEKNIGIFNGANKKIENLNSLAELNYNDQIFLMNQPGKIPSNLQIGNIKKINNDSSIDIYFLRDFSKNLKNEIVLIIAYFSE